MAPTTAVLAGLGASVVLGWADLCSRRVALLVTAAVGLAAISLLALLSRCEVLVLNGRGEWQLSATNERWVQEHFTREGLLWKRLGR